MAKPGLSRRAFLRVLLLGGIGAGLGIIRYNTASVGLGNMLRWVVRAQMRRFNPASVVALGYSPSYDEDLLAKLRELWRQGEMPDLRGKRILVKPNVLDIIDEPASITEPRLVGALIDLLLEMGVRLDDISVGDGSAFRRDTTSVARQGGLVDVLNRRGLRFIDLNYAEASPVKVKDGWMRQSEVLWLPRIAQEADTIISVPKLKSHHWTGATLGMKNLLGILPGARYGWPKNIIHVNGIDATILAMYAVLPPVLEVMDGIVGMQGNGPLFGTAVQHGLLAAGSDPVAVDITCAGLMGYAIESIPHLDVALQAGVAQSTRIELKGVPAEQLQKQYAAPPHVDF